MSPKKIILCPNPNRDQGMKATKAAEKILHITIALYILRMNLLREIILHYCELFLYLL